MKLVWNTGDRIEEKELSQLLKQLNKLQRDPDKFQASMGF